MALVGRGACAPASSCTSCARNVQTSRTSSSRSPPNPPRRRREGLLRSELLKITSTRLALGMLLGAVAYVVINVVALVFAAGQQGVPALTDLNSVRNVYASAGAASPVVLVAGILGMTTEYRFMTVTSTFLVTPRRGRVLTAKLVVHAGLGLVIGLVCSIVAAALATGLLTLKTHAAISASTVLQISGGTLLGYALYAVVGVSVGALVRNQVAAIIGALLWALVVEALVVAFAPAVGRWLPGGALQSALQATAFNGGKLLPTGVGVAVLLGYTVAFASWRRARRCARTSPDQRSAIVWTGSESASGGRRSAVSSQAPPSNPMAGFGPNEWLVDEIYQQYLDDKDSVDPAWWDFFADYQPLDLTLPRPERPSAVDPNGSAAPPVAAPPAAPAAPAAPATSAPSAAAAGRARGRPHPPPTPATARPSQPAAETAARSRRAGCPAAGRPRASWPTWRPASPSRPRRPCAPSPPSC